ncbi:MAG: DUF1631 family protein [Burkholderiaceae bacterium]|nr:DUF1631 family protein [Burkholderiaceae bacterium]
MLKTTSLKRRMGVSDDPGAQRPSLAQCLEAVIEQSESLIDEVLTGLDIAVAKARTAGSRGGDNNPLTAQAVEQLLSQRVAVRKTFVKHLREAVFGGGGPDSHHGTELMSFESLQLIEEEQLDENIEVARALQEIAISVDEALPPLDALMSTLLGWITVQSQINPLRPQLFVRALRATVADYIEDVDARGAVIGPASGRLGVGLQKLYREISDWLRSFGVEPAGITSSAVAPGAMTKPGAQMSSVARTLLTLDRLRKLLAGELDENGNFAPRNPQDFLHTIPASLETLQDLKQVDAMVKRLSKKAAKSAGDDTVVRKARKVAQTSKQLGKELGEEVARMMLDNLVEDERLLPRVRDLLQALEPVLVPLTKSDARFFSDRLHPARQFLDRVTHRSLGYTTEQDEGFPKFLKSVEDAIVALTENAGASGDSAPFGLALQRLEDIWAREDKAQRKRREEAARALLHAEQRNMLAQRLSMEFRDKAAGKEVPQMVVDFLGGAWAQAVAELQLTHPDGTPDPYGFLNLVDELIWSVQPSVARRNRTRLVEMVPRMLGQLRQGLHLIDYPPERISLLFDELIALHEKALEGIRIKPPPVEDLPDPRLSGANAQVQVAPEEVQDSEFWLADHEADDAGYLAEEAVMPMDLGSQSPSASEQPSKAPASVGELNTGAWIELMLDGAWIRAQLTWASPHRTLFMFTSRGGLAHSMSRRTMERLRSQGMIKLVSDGHVVDNALDAVAQTALRNTLDKNS